MEDVNGLQDNLSLSEISIKHLEPWLVSEPRGVFHTSLKQGV